MSNTPNLPSRYEDLDRAFRGRLRPYGPLIDLVQAARASMMITGGVRFLPVYGASGSGKTSAALELATHLPGCAVRELPEAAITDAGELDTFVSAAWGQRNPPEMLVVVIDQQEEEVAGRESLPTQFVERLSRLDRGDLRKFPTLFVWLTTSLDFQAKLADATRRNTRILQSPDFEVVGVPSAEWPEIIDETFAFHNSAPLADFGVIRDDLEAISHAAPTLGQAIEDVGVPLANTLPELQDISRFRVLMLWPVTDGERIQKVSGFTDPRQGYKLSWNTWYREVPPADQARLPMHAYNRARLYFDVRLVPLAAADLMPLCRDLDDLDAPLGASYLERFEQSHFFQVLNGSFDPSRYRPMRERDSQRASNARSWYETVTTQPTKLGRRLARILGALGLEAAHEQDVVTPHSTVRADVLVKPAGLVDREVIIELKAFSAANTMQSTIRDAIRTTLRRHAQLGGFLGRQ